MPKTFADDVLRDVAAADCGVARLQAVELLGVDGRVAVQERRGEVLAHLFDEGIGLVQAERAGIVGHAHCLDVGFAARGQHAASVIHLRGRGLGYRRAAVQLAPRR
ncbi:hypothetical protein G6F65_021839 [Rhizopus arrhizus]|nr:hypothetical protein G6F65_021839 [Rhizopus arrhizus]